MIHRSVAATAALIAACAAAPVAHGAAQQPPDNMRQTARNPAYAPVLFPTQTPARISSVKPTFMAKRGGSWSLLWQLADRSYLEVDRGPPGEYRRILRQARRQSVVAPRKLKVGERTVTRVCGHVCGLMWRQEGSTLSLWGAYYSAGEKALEADMRAIIPRLRPVNLGDLDG